MAKKKKKKMKASMMVKNEMKGENKKAAWQMKVSTLEPG